ncbi:signal peptidase [Paracoccus halophilus]|uniref:Signal peptidase n=1 Tax=Paracoccus halophilus TaxID=376733 RepID=A0A099EX52_9RHOB|nr:signal peptidase [Paracoccus halophilus]
MAPALALALSLASPAQADVASVIDQRILPDLAAFREAAGALAETAARTCDSEELRRSWNETFDVWLRVGFLNLGPGEEGGRNLAIAFWPDPKGIGARQQRRMLATEDPVVNDPARFAESSVALRGLFGLERLLYPDAPPEGDYACALIRATAADLARMATEIDQGWRDGFAQELLSAGQPGNDRFLSPAEAQQALFTQFMTGLEFIADRRLARPLATFERPRPERAEARASGRSLRNVELSLQALLDFATALAGDVPETRADIGQAIADARALDDPVFAGITDPQGYVRAESLLQRVRTARETALAEVGGKLGVSIGFNSADGD